MGQKLPRPCVRWAGVVAFGLFDLAIAFWLLAGLVGSIVFFLLRGRVALWLLVAFLAGAGLFVLFNVAYFNGFDTDPVIGSPSPAQVTGTWGGDHGATLVLRPDGTFTASGLPPYVGDTTGSYSTSGLPQNPPFGDGTWIIGPAPSDGSPKSVIFTFASCDGSPKRCAGYTWSFDLQAETGISGSGGLALFYYSGDPDDLADQYAFTRQ
jgi:hypothetical protein